MAAKVVRAAAKPAARAPNQVRKAWSTPTSKKSTATTRKAPEVHDARVWRIAHHDHHQQRRLLRNPGRAARCRPGSDQVRISQARNEIAPGPKSRVQSFRR